MSYPLEIINLRKDYDKKEAVKNISFKLNLNEILQFKIFKFSL